MEFIIKTAFTLVLSILSDEKLNSHKMFLLSIHRVHRPRKITHKYHQRSMKICKIESGVLARVNSKRNIRNVIYLVIGDL